MHTSSTPPTDERVLVLGCSGMLGNAVYRVLSAKSPRETFGSARSASSLDRFDESTRRNIVPGLDVEDFDALAGMLARIRPTTVVNCVGLVKQLGDSNDPLAALPINSILPHRLARLCLLAGARLVHISTDCVFSGRRGSYVEGDFPDAEDLYGRSKLIGEVTSPGAVTLRTSIIGRELGSRRALVDWFLSQEGTVRGFRRAVFSGLPTVELATVIRDHILPRRDLHGLYHVSSSPINKYDLLTLVRDAYGKRIDIVPDDNLAIDRSLSSQRFRDLTGYVPPAWPELVARMHAFG